MDLDRTLFNGLRLRDQAKKVGPIPIVHPILLSPREGLALPDASTHSEGFRRTRQARREALVDDYVELIADLIDDGREARQVDIATRLGVAQPTVAKMLARLAAEGLVLRKRYRGVFLTEAGQTLAGRCRERHVLVERFLLSLGVSEEVARMDAEGLEHHVSAETLEAFRRALDRQAADGGERT